MIAYQPNKYLKKNSKRTKLSTVPMRRKKTWCVEKEKDKKSNACLFLAKERPRENISRILVTDLFSLIPDWVF